VSDVHALDFSVFVSQQTFVAMLPCVACITAKH